MIQGWQIETFKWLFEINKNYFSVGKTSIINRFVNDEFSEHRKSTLGTAFHIKEFVVDNILITVQVIEENSPKNSENLIFTSNENGKFSFNVFWEN